MEVTNQFLIILKTDSLHEMEPIADTAKTAKNIRLDGSLAWGKPTTILLNEYSKKTTPDVILLYL